MYILMRVRDRLRLQRMEATNISRMTMTELAEFETRVWTLAERTKFPLRAVDVLNAIYREVEWRAQERDWRNAAYPGRRPRSVAEGTR